MLQNAPPRAALAAAVRRPGGAVPGSMATRSDVFHREVPLTPPDRRRTASARRYSPTDENHPADSARPAALARRALRLRLPDGAALNRLCRYAHGLEETPVKLTLREAATLLGRPPRTLRDQIARGEIHGEKTGGAWMVTSESLPLTDAHRRALQARAAEIRSAVEDVLPSRAATERSNTARSLADLEPFRKLKIVLHELRRAEGPYQAVRLEIQESLLRMAQANAQFDRDTKVVELRASRAALGRAIGHLLMESEDPLPAPVVHWLRSLEGEVLPLLAGLTRWAERLPRSRS